MTNTNITNLRKNLFEYIDQAVNYNDVINVNTKNGNAVIISENDYNSYLFSRIMECHTAPNGEVIL